MKHTKTKLSILLWTAFTLAINAQELKVSINGASEACEGIELPLEGIVSGAYADSLAFEWNFGDDKTANVQKVNHVFYLNGLSEKNLIISLTVKSKTSAKVYGKATSSVRVYGKAVPQLFNTANSNMYDTELMFRNCRTSISKDESYTISVGNRTNMNTVNDGTFTINWGDGSATITNLSKADFPLTHTYTKLKTYYLTISVTNKPGCEYSQTYPIRNDANPKMGLGNLGGLSGCSPYTFKAPLDVYQIDPITNEKVYQNSLDTKYRFYINGVFDITWNYDSLMANRDTFKYTFNSSSCTQPNSKYKIEFIAYNGCDETSGSIGGIKVVSAPKAAFTVTTNASAGNQISIINTSANGLDLDCSAISDNWQWDFGDGSTSFLKDPQMHTYTKPGKYTIKLTAHNGCDMVSVFEKNVTIDDAADIKTTDDSDANPIKIIPNPSNRNDKINLLINLSANAFRGATLRIISIEGRTIYMKNSIEKQVYLEKFNPGFYTVSIELATGRTYKTNLMIN